MTGNGLFGELAAWTGLAASPASTTPVSASADAVTAANGGVERVKVGSILDLCDQVLAAPGKRRHVFDWLRSSDGDGNQGMAVDAYYPSQQLVVLCQEQPEPDRSLCAELVRAHGLSLFRVDFADFQADPGPAFSRLIGELRPFAPTTLAPRTTLEREPAPPPTLEREPPPLFAGNGAGGGAVAKEPAPDSAYPPPQPLPVAPPPHLAPLQPLPVARPPLPPVRESVAAAFQPFMSAVQRFTAAPQPFVLPPEPAAPPPETPAPEPFVAAPLPFTPAPLPFAPTPPPPPPPVAAAPAPAQRAASSSPLPAALQRYLTTPPPPTPQAAPPPPQAAAPTPQFEPAAPGGFIQTPLPFARTAPPLLDPVLESLITEPVRELKRRRVGQHQAEAAARAARFVETRAAGSRPAPRPAPRPAGRPAPGSASPNRPAQWWNVAGITPASVGFPSPPDPVVDIDGHPLSPSNSNARAEAIERALARGRAIPDPHRPPPTEPSHADADGIVLGFVVACVMAIELYIGVAVFAFGGGPSVLGLGLALDAAARALGTVAAARSGKEWGPGWRWICGLGGSPAVAMFAIQRNGTLLAADPAPLAGPLAVVAVIVILIGLAGIPVGI